MGQKSVLNEHDPDSMVIVGRIGASFGLKGFVHVNSFTEDPLNILRYKTWHLRKSEHYPWHEMKVIESRAHGKGVVACLEGCFDCNAAESLRNQEIAVKREALPALNPGEFYWVELIGLSVITESGEVLGKIEDVFETGANDVIVVKGKDKEHLIPYVPDEYVLEVDLDARIMRVAWDPEF